MKSLALIPVLPARNRTARLLGAGVLAALLGVVGPLPSAQAVSTAPDGSVPTVGDMGQWPRPEPAAPAATDRSRSGPARAAAGDYAAAVLADAPLAYWRLDELSGTVAADSSGNGRTATLHSVAGYQRPGALVGDPGTAINAGNSAVLTAPSAGFPAGSTARTLEFWASTGGCCGTSSARYGRLGSGAGFSAAYSYDAGVLSVDDGVASHGSSLREPYDLNDSNWHLFHFVYAAGRVVVYVDGVAVHSAAFAGLNTTPGGGFTVGTGGWLDEVAVYPRALTPARIAAHWTAGSSAAAACAPAATGRYPTTVLSDAPIVYYRADDIVATPTGRVLYDSSGNCRNGAIRYTDRSVTGALVGDGNAATAGSAAAGAGALPAGNAPRTVEFWGSSSGCCGEAGAYYGNFAAGNGFSVAYRFDSGRLVVDTGGQTTTLTFAEPFNLNDGRWHLFAVTVEDGTVVVYVDGVAASTAQIGPLATDVSVGLTVAAPTFDEVAVYGTALSAARIASHWTAGSAAAGAPACASTPTSRYASAVLADAPAAYYRAGDIATSAKGRVAFDSSGRCHNGSLRYTDRSATGAVLGDPDASVAGSFSAPAATLPEADAARTVEFWLTSAGCCGRSGVGYGDFTRANGFALNYEFDTGRLYVEDGGSELSTVELAEPFDLNDGRWHLFDVTYDGTTVVVYVDGYPAGRALVPDLTTDATVGLYANGRTVDEVAVYPTALSAQRVAAHWTAGSSTAAGCSGVPTGRYASSVLGDRPTSYYRLNDIVANSKGRVAFDASGHCNNGSLRYTDTAATGALPGDGDGAIAGDFSAHGATLPAGSSARTVEYWTKTSGCCGSAFVAYGNHAEGNEFSVQYLWDSNRLTVGDGSGSVPQLTVYPSVNLNDGEWHLIHLVFTGTRATFYVDGLPVGDGPLTGLSTDVSVGLYAGSQHLDEVAVYPRALSARRVAAHWTASGRG